MVRIQFDFNNMMSFAVGRARGATDADIRGMSQTIKRSHQNLRNLIKDKPARIKYGLEWTRLPFQDKYLINNIQRLGDQIARRYENVIFLGIGGSYLGLKAAQDALLRPYYNEFADLRHGRPRIYFDGNNLDPDTLGVLLKELDPKKTFVVVISKSGETTETKAAFSVVEPWLRKAGRHYGRQVFVITDPESGALRDRVDAEQAEDPQSFCSLPVLKGVGGRFSELNIGLLHLAITGIRIADVLKGAGDMMERCSSPDIFKNPAYMYAVLHTILYKKKDKHIAIMMPFSETLKSTADWYVQLLAESLGKKRSRAGRVVNVGRTPIPARGTNDLHSIQQNNIEGENNKAVTFIRVEKFKPDLVISERGGILTGKRYSRLLSIAEEATEWALAIESRPSSTIIMPEISPYHWGGLLLFFEMATAFEGELLDVNAFDQPGVEGYKNYMYYKLKKPGLPGEVAGRIRDNPLIKKDKYIL